MTEDIWETVLKIKPIVSQYTANKQFRSRYYNLRDSLLAETQGTWRFKQDTLHLSTQGKTTAYAFSKKGTMGSFVGYLDWDEDGVAEELYKGKQEKQ